MERDRVRPGVGGDHVPERAPRPRRGGREGDAGADHRTLVRRGEPATLEGRDRRRERVGEPAVDRPLEEPLRRAGEPPRGVVRRRVGDPGAGVGEASRVDEHSTAGEGARASRERPRRQKVARRGVDVDSGRRTIPQGDAAVAMHSEPVRALVLAWPLTLAADRSYESSGRVVHPERGHQPVEGVDLSVRADVHVGDGADAVLGRGRVRRSDRQLGDELTRTRRGGPTGRPDDGRVAGDGTRCRPVAGAVVLISRRARDSGGNGDQRESVHVTVLPAAGTPATW